MLVPTMTPEEIYAEMYKDAAWLQNRVNNKLIDEAKKKAKRAKRFPHVSLNTLISEKTNIEYKIVFYTYQHGDWDRPRMFIYTKYTHEMGKTLVYIEQSKFAIRIYTPHFMQRYKERQHEHVQEFSPLANKDIEFFFLLRNWDVEEMKVIKGVLQTEPDDEIAVAINELQTHSRFWQDPEYERYSVACISGMCLCERHKKNPNISIFDTYINHFMIKYSQMFDYIPAFARVFLDAVVRAYPRQKHIICKEWNETVDNTPANSEMLEHLCDKLSELDKRYPLSALL